MAQKTFTSTFQRNMETSWVWYRQGSSGEKLYWATNYQSGGGPTILAQDYTVSFDISDLPTGAIITNVGITFPWHNTGGYITSDLTIKIGDTIKSLPTTATSGVRYRLITFDSIDTNYTKSGTTLTVPVAYFRYAGTKPGQRITGLDETISPDHGSSGWFTGYNPSGTPTGYADEAVYITVDYTAATQGGSNNGAGGAGGGGRGNYKGNTNSAGVAGTANTGGGGGGAGYYYTNGTATITAPGAGGSGVVIIRNTRF